MQTVDCITDILKVVGYFQNMIAVFNIQYQPSLLNVVILFSVFLFQAARSFLYTGF